MTLSDETNTTSGGGRAHRGRGGLARVRRPRRGGAGSRSGVRREAPAEQAARFAAGAGARGRTASGCGRRRGRRRGSSRLRARLARPTARRRRAPRRMSRRVVCAAAGVVLDGRRVGGASGALVCVKCLPPSIHTRDLQAQRTHEGHTLARWPGVLALSKAKKVPRDGNATCLVLRPVHSLESWGRVEADKDR